MRRLTSLLPHGLFIILGCCAIVAVTVANRTTPLRSETAQETVAAAEEWLATLSADERKLALLPYESEKRVDWHFIPKDTRKGFPLRDMTDDQRDAAIGLLKSLVSESGFAKTKSIMALEGVLLELEGAGSQGKRDPTKYYFTVFGEPTSNSEWGISIEGHHLSLNFTLDGTEIVDSTPQFVASNPAELKRDFNVDEHPEFKAGFRVLSAEEDFGFKLVNSLSESERNVAIVSSDAPDEIRWAGVAQPELTEPQGIMASDMSAEQRLILNRLIESYLTTARTDVAESRRKLIDTDGMDSVYFAWAGATKPGVGHYYCVQGKSFIIEFINVQPDAEGNPANHVHCVWRDLTGDFNLPATNN